MAGPERGGKSLVESELGGQLGKSLGTCAFLACEYSSGQWVVRQAGEQAGEHPAEVAVEIAVQQLG